ncbi:ABC-F family ATP-binding cassette domain-containing protein [Sphingobacterium psychroaquaticum]|nr:ABC-F family ATP-binding cassette domain-containing protein [Sphingobacterium psychroaquaticum]
MLIIDNISYIHQDKEVLFTHLNFSLRQGAKAALIGNNGAGKSTLLKLIAGLHTPNTGQIRSVESPYYIPQILDQYQDKTVAEALQVAHKLHAFYEILAGNASEEHMLMLDDDWSLEERCHDAFTRWDLKGVNLNDKMATLSGGQKSRVFLAGIHIHQAKFIIMDEPSNHLDNQGRQLLYAYIEQTAATLLIVSHDRTLLNLLDTMYELSKEGIKTYGGNYDFYAEQKDAERNALGDHIQAMEKDLRKAKEKERAVAERQQKLDARGKKKQEKAGVARIMMNTLRNNAENSSAKSKQVHSNKTNNIGEELSSLRMQRADIDKMKFGFERTSLHQGKVLFELTHVNHQYEAQAVWSDKLNLKITSGERIALKGKNGSGKTTFIRLLLGALTPATGSIFRTAIETVYIDQDYSLLNDALSVYEQAEDFNDGALQEHDIKIRLDRFLFNKESWNKSVAALSGGERMRLALCCLTISNNAPELLVLDEPTNNLDIQNIEILTAAIQQYQGTLLVVSHDAYFLNQIAITREIELVGSSS